MIHLQKYIKEALQKEFDKNTKDILFDVSLYNTKNNEYLTKEIDVENTYHVEQKKYTPVIIQDIFGEYTPVENSTILQGNITSTLLTATDSNDINDVLIEDGVENVLVALDEIRINNQGKSIPIGNVVYGFGEIDIEYESAATTVLYLKGKMLDDGTIAEFQDIANKTYKLVKDGNTIKLITVDGSVEMVRASVTYSGKEVEILSNVSLNRLNLRVDSETNQSFETIISLNENFYSNEGLKINGSSIKLEELKLFSVDAINIQDVDDIEIPLEEVVANESEMKIIIDNFQTGENVTPSTSEFDYIYTVDEIYSTMGNKGSMQIEFSVANPTTNQFTYANGVNYQEFVLEWGLTYSDNVFNGNDVKYYLDGIRIHPTHRSTGVSNTQNAQQNINDKTSKSANEDNVITKTYTLHYNDDVKIGELAEHIASDELEQNKLWTLKEIYPTFSKEYEVIIIDGGMSPTMNTPLSFSIEVALADDMLN